MSAGPMPPPPLKWQPVRFIWLNSCSPSAMASLFPSNRFPIASGGRGGGAPLGKRLVTETSLGPRPALGAVPCCAPALLAATTSTAVRAIDRSRATTAHRSGFRKREHIERPSGCGLRLEIRHNADHAERAGRIARVKVTGDDGARPAAYPRQDGDIFVAVRSAIGHRLADDPRASLELPFEFARLGVDGFEPAIHGSVKDESARGGHRAAPQRQVLLDSPDRLALYWIPCCEFAAITAGARLTHDLRADEWRASDVADGPALPIHAEVFMRYVHEPGQW